MWIKEIESELKEDIIPFWLQLKDSEYGGFYGYLSYELKLDCKADKGTLLNSRILWFFSNAYMLLKDPCLLEAATHAYRWLVDYAIDYEYGGVHWSLTYDGKPKDVTKHTYNLAFAIYALASYYAASREGKALSFAYDLVNVVEEKCRDDEGYLEAFDRSFCPAVNDKLSENGIIASRTMNTFLHVFEAYTEMYRVDKSKMIEKRLCEMMELFADKIFNLQLRRQEVFFDKNYNSLIDLHSYGHDIETAWLIDRGVKILSDGNAELGEEYEKKMSPITAILEESVYRLAFDGTALYNECENKTNDTKRIWWVQAEGVVGFLNAYMKNPEREEYIHTAERIWEYIKDTIIDPREGSEWLSEVDEEGVAFSRKPIVEQWKCPYHNGRMCMEVLKRAGGLSEVMENDN